MEPWRALYFFLVVVVPEETIGRQDLLGLCGAGGDTLEKTAEVHAFVFCWPGKEASAHHIARSLHGHVDTLTVLYKNDTGQDETGPGEWRRIPNERYYGWQFRESLELARGDIILHVQADTSCDDWPYLVQRCRHAFAAFPELGVWSANVYHSPYVPDLVRTCSLEGEELVGATLTDGIVWALAGDLGERMKALDYSGNNFGWGVMEAAAAMAMSKGQLVAMDVTVKVAHPKGSSYNREQAALQSGLLTRQLLASEQNYIRIAQALMHYRQETSRMRPAYQMTRFLRAGYWRQLLRAARGQQPEPEAMPEGMYELLI